MARGPRAAPSTPSLPMPVRTTSSRRRPKSLAASSIVEVGARAQAADRRLVGEHGAALGVEAQVQAARARAAPCRARASSPAAASTTRQLARRCPGARRARSVKPGRHVLDDHACRRRAARAAAGTSCGERARAAGRGGDEDERLGPTGDGAAGGRARRRRGRRGGAVARPPRGGRGRARRRAAAVPAAQRARGGADLLGELRDERGERLAGGRLGDEVERALGQRVDGAGAVGGRERRDDDDGDRRRARAAQLAQDADAVACPASPGRASSRPAAGGGRASSASSPSAAWPTTSKPRVAQGVREHPAHEAGVVGDDDAGGGARRSFGPELTQRRDPRPRRCPRGRAG